MTAQLVAIVIVAVPVLLTVLLRVNAVIVFFSVACGILLQRSLGESAQLALGALVQRWPTAQIAHVGLLWLPLAITLIISRRTARHGAVIVQLLPVVMAGLVGMIFTVPPLPDNVQSAIYGGRLGAQLARSQDVIIALAVVLNLLVAWRVYRHHDEHKKHSKHGS